jgi:hypothetical protein
MEEAKDLLGELGNLYSVLPVEALLVGHCLCVASWFPQLRKNFLLSWWVSVLIRQPSQTY